MHSLLIHKAASIAEKPIKNALIINRSNILSQSEDTILAPGHGPLTTVNHEKQNNPFYAKSANELHLRVLAGHPLSQLAFKKRFRENNIIHFPIDPIPLKANTCTRK